MKLPTVLGAVAATLSLTFAPAIGQAGPSEPCTAGVAETSGGSSVPEGCAATVLYFNDAHDIRPVEADGVSRGGVARLATVIADAGAEHPNHLVAFGGDLAGGTLFGGIYRGFPIVEALNEIGVDIANFGQHDFDFGVATTRDLVAASDFPWLSSNLVDDEGPFSDRPWMVASVGAFTIGFLGLTDAMETTGATAEVDQLPVIDAARSAVADMVAAEHPDAVVALTQQPLEQNEALLTEVGEIDVVLTEEMEEDSSVLIETDDGRWILAPEGNIGSVIAVDITDPGDGLTITPRVLEVDATVTPDPDLRLIEEQYAAEIEVRLGEQIATVETPLLLPGNAHRQGESALGNLVADAFRSPTSFADEVGTDIGWIQGGGLRAEVPGPAFTLESGYSVLPFGSKVVKVRATGAQIREALEHGLSAYDELGGGFPQVSGMAYEFDPQQPVGSRVIAVRVGDAELDPEATYTVALTDYLYTGGDGVTAFADAELLVDPATATVDAEALIAFVRQLEVINYTTEDRIVAA